MAKSKKFVLNEENYFSPESAKMYCSASQYKSFFGCGLYEGCEYKALAEINGEYVREKSDALLLGSFVDCMLTEPEKLEQFYAEHPEMISSRGATKGELKSEFKLGQRMVERAMRDQFFMKTMNGEHQKIMTGEIGGLPFKIKMDVYNPDKFIVDLKTTQSIRKPQYNPRTGRKESFVLYMGYHTQGAIYQEIVRQNTGKTLPFFISAISSELEPDIEVIQIDNDFLAEELEVIKSNAEIIKMLKNGEAEPCRCNKCEWCRRNKVLTKPVNYLEIDGEI